MNSSSNVLPNELLTIILNKVAISNPTDLFSMLFVSRRFYDLAIPILYEDISHEIDTTSTPKVLSSLQASPHLSLTKQFTLIAPFLPRSMSVTALPAIFASLTHIEKLWLQIEDAGTTLLTSIGSSTLTHLSFTGGFHPPDLVNTLTTQTSLRHLTLMCFTGRIELPVDALPNLCLMFGPMDFWSDIAKGRSIHHVHSLYVVGREFVHTLDKDQLGSIVSLKLVVSDVTCLRELIPHMKNVEYLRLTVEVVGFGVQVNTSPTINDYLVIPSKKLRYCNVGHISVSLEDSRRMFDTFPRLDAVDSNTPSDDELFVVVRYVRGALAYVVTEIPAVKQWGRWWENVCRGL
ncbi:hypothetical protein ONZ45_g6979 [Pleurotus djamor]|nr:hypothetical protein ONZ45_g6979 [Pleurotus djamor]